MMHIANIVTFLAFWATGSALVIPRIVTAFDVPMGTLPQITPTIDTITIDLTNVDNAATKLIATLSNTDGDTVTGVLKSSLDIPSVISHTIGLQSANRQAMLDAKEIDSVFSPSDSASIVNKLKNDIYPHAQTALKLLGDAKTKNLLTTLATTYAVLPYLNVVVGEYDTFSSELQQYLDAGSQADAKKVLDDIKNLLTTTIATYTPTP
ncbi:hypothetical protein CkaCkLH20_08149 [Colletotrichum karsti]|uniref:Antigenic cell wall n=1 Tax=Colletotrichum karsti TaxID=1095194 RepID=A0A9P6I3A9_9PEZI|nr:uncharacterized protein CkaCkLH20_08149 [Colletotrichum karsti]KAF9874166.1 hypothetical protein CkaCkLH20_08149 [Colletotrichum karsti]